ncbi:MAG TPA: TIGR03936 family radical SAM-associated protein [Anaerolineales bacterium]
MRLRIIFSKSSSLRYTGHLDLYVVWERTVRRTGLPLSYTQGFHPGPKIQIASALPLGFIGRCEIVDIWLDSTNLDPRTASMLQSSAPHGLGILSVDVVDEHGPALQTQVASAEYEINLLDPLEASDLSERVAKLLQADTLPRQRRGKPYDLRPLVEVLQLQPLAGAKGLFMRLSARNGATGRPEEVLDCLGIPFENTRIERTRLILI